MAGDDDIYDDDTEQDSALEEPAEVKRKKLTRDQEAKVFWRGVFADPIGRREMWDLLKAAHPFEERFACGPSGFPQTEATWFHAGEQALGLRIFQSWFVIDREGVSQMLDENDTRFMKPKRKKSNGDT